MKRKTIKVGINGLGRIGRQLIHQLVDNSFFKIQHINELNTDLKNIVYLLNYDSIYENNKKQSFEARSKKLIYKKKIINATHFEDTIKVNWKKKNCDIVIDSTGILKNVTNSKRIGLPVFVTHTPSKGIDNYVIANINDQKIHLKKNSVTSLSICDATAIAPIIEFVIKKVGKIDGHVTTLHPWLSYQNLLDNYVGSSSIPSQYWKEYSLGRASVGNLIPKETSTVKALEKSMNINLENLTSLSIRVPTSIVSSAIMTFSSLKQTKNKPSKDLFVDYFKSKPHVHLNYESKVSSDFKRSSYACSVDMNFLKMSEKTMSILIWYDNEAGYVSQIINSIKKILK